MNYQVSYEARGQYLLAHISGPYDPVDARDALKQVREQAVQTGFTRILLDAMTVSAASSEIDRYSMGEAFAALLPPPFKVAVLYATITDKFTENTAVLRGANMLVCSDKVEALAWLLADGTEEAEDDERT
jgi:hypothetical protein